MPRSGAATGREGQDPRLSRRGSCQFCTDGEEGLTPLAATEAPAHGLDAEGCRPVAAWEDDHGQVDISILQLSPLVSGPPALVRVNA
ncbi:hypothetical protein ACWEV4_23390 [Streptomyces sp. NPDC003860]